MADLNSELTPRPENAISLKDQTLHLLQKGALSTGREYEVTLSRKSAVSDGLHLVLTIPENPALEGKDKPSAAEELESLSIVLGLAKDLPLAKEFGCRVGVNFGLMRTRAEWHIHVIIPGSESEAKSAPRLIDPWNPVQ